MHHTIWKVANENKYFKKISNTRWIEVVDGEEKFSFDSLLQNEDELILYAPDRNFYIKLDANCFTWGYTINKFDKFLYTGRWMD